MDTLLTIIGGVAGLALGLFGGFQLGARIEKRPPALYWFLNVVALVFAVVVGFVGLIYGMQWLFVAAIGFEAGTLTGLKYGYGHSVGVWAVHDRLTGNDRDLQD